MSRKTQGFASQGGRGVSPKTVSGYSEKDLSALSKVASTELGAGGLGTTNVVLCDLCGEPVAGSAKSSPERFLEEMSKQRHFMCHMNAERTRQLLEEQKLAAMTPQQREDYEAERYNNGGNFDPRDNALIAEHPEIPEVRLEETPEEKLERERFDKAAAEEAARVQKELQEQGLV